MFESLIKVYDEKYLTNLEDWIESLWSYAPKFNLYRIRNGNSEEFLAANKSGRQIKKDYGDAEMLFQGIFLPYSENRFFLSLKDIELFLKSKNELNTPSGMGRTLPVFDLKTKRKAYVKFPFALPGGDPIEEIDLTEESVDSLENPAQGVHVYGSWQENYNGDINYMFMRDEGEESIKYLEGIKSKRELFLTALEVIEQVASQLQSYMFEGNFFHLDVKPENITIEETGSNNKLLAHLIDFGIVGNGDPSNLGTYPFGAPETTTNDEYDERSLVHMLAVTAYFLFSPSLFKKKGFNPFLLKVEDKKLIRYLTQPRNLTLYPEVYKVLAKATNIYAAERYQSLEEFCEALRDAILNTNLES